MVRSGEGAEQALGNAQAARHALGTMRYRLAREGGADGGAHRHRAGEKMATGWAPDLGIRLRRTHCR